MVVQHSGIFEEKSKTEVPIYRLTTADGHVDFGYKHDLNDEEGEGYLPDYYSNATIELLFIDSHNPGGGTRLMEQFLNHDAVKAARLILLDCSPLYDTKRSESEAFQRLHDFYSRFGFVSRSNNGRDRMFRIQGLPRKNEVDWNMDNDFHPVLRSEIRRKEANLSYQSFSL